MYFNREIRRYVPDWGESIREFHDNLIRMANSSGQERIGRVDNRDIIVRPGFTLKDIIYCDVEEKNDIRNPEHYSDPTPYQALNNIERSEEHERFHKFMGAMLRIAELSDFSIEERIVVKDKRTGRIWR